MVDKDDYSDTFCLSEWFPGTFFCFFWVNLGQNQQFLQSFWAEVEPGVTLTAWKSKRSSARRWLTAWSKSSSRRFVWPLTHVQKAVFETSKPLKVGFWRWLIGLGIATSGLFCRSHCTFGSLDSEFGDTEEVWIKGDVSYTWYKAYFQQGGWNLKFVFLFL